MLIRDVMTVPAVTVTTQTSTDAALRLMRDEEVTSVAVIDYRGSLIGIVTEIDLVQDKAEVEVDDRPWSTPGECAVRQQRAASAR